MKTNRGHLNAFANRSDANQPAIVKALRRNKFQVYNMSNVGSAFPDLLVSHNNRMILLEVKQPNGLITPKQLRFLGLFLGLCQIVTTETEALDAALDPVGKAFTAADKQTLLIISERMIRAGQETIVISKVRAELDVRRRHPATSAFAKTK